MIFFSWQDLSKTKQLLKQTKSYLLPKEDGWNTKANTTKATLQGSLTLENLWAPAVFT